ncbi:Early nodulin-like protein 1 [Bienertia sinuspersici]
MMSKVKFVSAMHVIGVVSVVLFMQRGEATQFTVGGSKGWCVPSDNGAAYNQWAEKMRFQIGDSILFVYPSGKDSVLQVSKEDYSSCTTTSPITKYTDGHTDFKFTKSGPYHFISGNKDNCNKNEKLVVVVMADRSSNSSSKASSPPAPAPSVSDHEQQQPPVGSQQQPPVSTPQMQPPVASPPTDDGTTGSGLAPSAESNPPPNGAAAFAMSFVGSFAAFVGSSLVLAF